MEKKSNKTSDILVPYGIKQKTELLLMLEREEGLRRDWDEKYGDRMQKLVFIGQKP